MPASIHTFKTPEALEAHADEWIAFCDDLPMLPPFCRPQTWIPGMQNLLRHAGGEVREVIIIETRDGDTLKAILPLYRTRTYLQSLSENHLDYQDVAATDQAAASTALERAVRYARESNLVFLLGNVSEQSMLAQGLGRASFNHLARTFRRYFGVCIVSDFELESTGGDALISSFSRRQKRNYNYASNRMKAQMPELEVEFLYGSDITTADLDAVSQLHQTNQQHRTGESPFANPVYVEFLHKLTKTQPNLLLSRITSKGELVAFCLGYADEGIYYYYLTDYDRRFASVSPGLWLMNRTCAHLADARPVPRFRIDFLLGSESYKTQWETGRYYVDRVVIVPRTFRRIPWSFCYLFTYTLKHFKNRLFRIGNWAE